MASAILKFLCESGSLLVREEVQVQVRQTGREHGSAGVNLLGRATAEFQYQDLRNCIYDFSEAEMLQIADRLTCNKRHPVFQMGPRSEKTRRS